MVKFFIEIGTSDFDTYEDLARQGWKGIFVEPVKALLDNLERFEGCIYENTAITHEPMHTKMIYYDPEWAKGWVRGLGTLNMDINHMHSNPQWKEHERIMDIDTMTLDQLIEKHNVKHIDSLKIDTEGSEYKILDTYSWKIKPEIMKIEYQHWEYWTPENDPDGNGLSNTGINEDKYIEMFKDMGYSVSKGENDLLAVLNE